MKKITLLLLLALSCGALTTQAQVWSENFNSGIPSNWVTYNDANTVSTSDWTLPVVTGLTKNGWMTWPTAVAGDSTVISVSRFRPAATADRWLVTPKFKVTDPHTVLYFHYVPLYAVPYADTLEVWVSTGDSAKSSFKTLIYADNSSTSLLTKHGVSIGAYNGKSIHIAFREHTTNLYLITLDNVGTEIPTNHTDMQLNWITPLVTQNAAYNTISSSVNINGAVTNLGYDTVKTFNVKYQQGTNTPVSQTITSSYPIYTGTTFSFSYTIPSAGALPIKVWVELTGDQDHTNDTLTTTLTGVYNFPKKRLVFEEGTGTWCGWCVRGIVYMDSLFGTNSNDASFIAVHNGDPMAVTSYDSLERTQISGFPSVVVDRRETVDPSGIIAVFNNENNYFGFAKIDLTSPKVTGSNFTVTANVTPSLDLSGDYRLALVLTEDNVHGTATTWDQHNYYSYQTVNTPLKGQGVDYQAATNPIPAAKMFYKFVALSSTPSMEGAAGSLPSSMTHGTKYSYNFSAPLSTSWNKPFMRAYVLLIRHSDGQILNSQEIGVNTGVANIEAGVNALKIFPNPATNETYLNVELTKTTDATVSVTDITGKVIFHNSVNKLVAGSYYYNIPTSNLPNGIYLATFITETGTVTSKFVVAH